MKNSLSDIYDRSKQLAAKIEQPLPRWHDEIIDAIEGGATSGEVLSNVQGILRKLLPDLNSQSVALQSEAQKLINDIGKLLS